MVSAARVVAVVVAFLVSQATGVAHDKWEFLPGGASDDIPGPADGALNVLTHGAVQTHDLEGTLAQPDRDWMAMPTLLRHSYEARVAGNSLVFDQNSCPPCARISRVTAGGTMLTADIGPSGVANDRSVRFMASATQDGSAEYIRVSGPVTGFTGGAPTANHQYTLQFFDTTYFLPRFNNANGQVTILLIQNTTPFVVSGNVHFYQGSGTLLHTAPFTVAGHGLGVLNTAAMPAIASLSGSATIAHDGGWGGLAAKAVAVEPATGFTFDTPATTLPR
ncbi:MAG: hypothetical protein ABW221_16730 [Vicinamibacteria bacterium]